MLEFTLHAILKMHYLSRKVMETLEVVSETIAFSHFIITTASKSVVRFIGKLGIMYLLMWKMTTAQNLLGEII